MESTEQNTPGIRSALAELLAIATEIADDVSIRLDADGERRSRLNMALGRADEALKTPTVSGTVSGIDWTQPLAKAFLHAYRFCYDGSDITNGGSSNAEGSLLAELDYLFPVLCEQAHKITQAQYDAERKARAAKGSLNSGG